MFDLIIVRHGNTFDPGDTVTRVGGRTDLPLSSSGRAQADALGRHFAVTPLTSITSSPLARTWQTAQAVHAAQPSGTPAPQAHVFLKEIDYGPDENQPEEAVTARLGADALRRWDEDADMPEDWSPRPEELRRLWDAWITTLADFHRDGEIHMVVTSNGVARFALDVMSLDRRPETIKLKTAAFGRFRVDSGLQATVMDWNVRPT